MPIVQFDRSALTLPPKAVIDFLAKLEFEDTDAAERRESERKPMALEVAVVPVDNDLKQCGEGFLAISKDISAIGMAFVHTRAVTTATVVVELTNRNQMSMQLLAHVVRCQAIHRFYEVGLRFVTRLAG